MGLASLTDFAAALPSSGPGWLAVAFLLGLVHALDADHVMALSVLATRGRGAADGARAGLRWSVGHGLVVVLVGGALVALGQALPASLGAASDKLVGVAMIGLGVFVWLELARRRAHLHFHAHDGLPPHAHWHGHVGAGHQHEHGALLIGALHGLAGSAPILAVLPIAQRSPLLAFACLAVFGVGVAVAMIGVSGMLGHLAGRLAVHGTGRGWTWLRGLGASGSVALGAWLAFGG